MVPGGPPVCPGDVEAPCGHVPHAVISALEPANDSPGGYSSRMKMILIVTRNSVILSFST